VPGQGYGKPVVVEGEVSAPKGDHTDIVSWTAVVPPKSQTNTGQWAFKGTVKCLEGEDLKFTNGVRTDTCRGNKTIVDMIMTPIGPAGSPRPSTQFGTVKLFASMLNPGSPRPIYTKYSLTFNCNIYRPN